jgi:sporulation protein YlmC with PRC-barrel domain
MLHVISALKGFAIEATDGRIGTVVDFLFDDGSWKIRWLVVDCGSWLEGRKVLIHPSAISYAGFKYERFEVTLTKAQVDGSPALLEHQPVSQQMQSRLYDYYGWDPDWSGSYFGGMSGGVEAPPYLGSQMRAEPRTAGATPQGGDPHLRSVVEVIGYYIQATDGEIGHVENLMLDNEDWSLQYLIVNTSNWWFGKSVLIALHAVILIDWFSRKVQLDVPREKVKLSPPWDPLVALDESSRTDLHAHYGWPRSGA